MPHSTDKRPERRRKLPAPLDALKTMAALIETGEANPDLIYIATQQFDGTRIVLRSESAALEGTPSPDALTDMLRLHLKEMFDADD